MEKMKDQELEKVTGGQYITILNDVDVYWYQYPGASGEPEYMDPFHTYKSGEVIVVIETEKKVIDGITYVRLDGGRGWVRLDQVQQYFR